jgi:hypothetical protein
MVKKRGTKCRPWNKGREVGKKGAFAPAQVKRIRKVLMARGVSGLRDLALFQVAIDTMLHGPDLFNLTVKDVQLPNGKIRSVIKAARRGGMLPVRCAFPKRQPAHLENGSPCLATSVQITFSQAGHRVSSSNGGSTHEPSAEILDCRGRARSQEVRQRILTTDKGSPHFERHRRFGDGSDAPRSLEDRINGEVSARAHNVRPNRY